MTESEPMDGEETRLFLGSMTPTPLGRVQVAGYIQNTWRRCTWPMRLLGIYAIVYVTDGTGRFRDALGHDQEILPGDLIVLFPDVAHSYGPKPGGHWSEVYAHFDGPAFELWRQAGVLDPAMPVHRMLPVERWQGELEAVLKNGQANTEAGQMIMASRLLALLTQMLTANGSGGQPQWLQTACALLKADFNQPCPLENIAQAAGLTYHTFRRLFEQATGLAPAQYRFARRMEAAFSLLLMTQLPLRDIAERLNFNDESHFSNRFQWYTGVRPSRYRHEGRRGSLPLPADSMKPENALFAGSTPEDFE